MNRLAARIARAIRKHLTQAVIQRHGAPEPEEHHDAEDPPDDDIDGLMHAMHKSVSKELESGELPKVTDIASKRVVKHSQNEFARLGIKLKDAEPKLAKQLNAWRSQCADRITGMADDQLDKIKRLLENNDNMRVETLARELEWQIDEVTASRAEFIARDQVLSLNAVVTKERQQAAAIEKFVWSTSNDERVREEHAALEGKVFSWDEGGDPEEGIPGEAPMCRCVAFPILPELGDDDKEDDE